MHSLSTQYPPTIVCIERYFRHFNNSTITLAKIHGIINYKFYNVSQIYYPPKTIKETIIHGNATKERMRKIIESAYPNVNFQNNDESDSFAVVLTFLIKNNYIEWDKNKYR